MTPIIETRGLTKVYGKLTAVRNLNLTVEEGAVFGFVGPNGAGKTTTMRMLATLLAPTAGEAWIAGRPVRKDRKGVRRAIGYMPDFFGVYGDMKVWEYLDFFAACYEIPPATRRPLIGDLLELVELSHRRDDYVDHLSRGMKQRLCLARALAHDPQVLILDEPASGLDPRARVEIRELLRELQSMGKTIFLSSHILSELAEVCTHVGIIEAGQMVALGTLAEIQQQVQKHRIVRVGLLERVPEAQAWLLSRPDVAAVQASGNAGARPGGNGSGQAPAEDVPRAVAQDGPGELTVEFSGDDRALSALVRALVEAGFDVLAFNEQPGDLEDLFMRLTKGVVS